MKSLDL